MKRRYALFGMTALLAVALTVPAFGGPDNPVADTFASAKSTAKKALKKAKQANKAAKTAQTTADGAQGSADAAQAAADTAQTSANTAQTSADTAQTTADNAGTAAAAAQATADAKYGTMEAVFGDSVGPDGATSKLAFATCPGASSPTGGGFAVSGGTQGTLTPVLSSSYLGAWTTRAVVINGEANASWSLQANVECIAP
jgi:membrane protein involved in colicin uptake